MKLCKNIFRSWIAVIARSGGCSFADKVKIATKANYSAAIIYNLESDKVNLLEAGLNNETDLASLSSDADPDHAFHAHVQWPI